MSEDKTESASPRRLQKAREEGDIPVSRELALVSGLAGGLTALSVQLAAAPDAPLRWFAHALRATTPDLTRPLADLAAGMFSPSYGIGLMKSIPFLVLCLGAQLAWNGLAVLLKTVHP